MSDVTPGVSVDLISLNAANDKADAAFDAALDAANANPAPAQEASPAPEPAKEPEVAKTETGEAAVPPPAEATPPVPANLTSEERRNLLAKFNGDEDAAAKAYWEANNNAARLAREKEELAAKLAAYEKQASTAAPEAPKPAPQELPIELKRYDEKIRAVETNFATVAAERELYVGNRQKGVLGEGPRLDQVIRDLTRKLGSNNLSLDRDAITEELRVAINEREAINAYVSQLDDKLKGFDEKWQELKENRDIRAAILEQRKELEAAREAKARSEEEREASLYIGQFQTQWNQTIEKVSKDKSVIPEVLSEGFEKYVRTLGKAYVADGTPIEDVAKFVADAAKDYMAEKQKFHQVQSAEYAKQKKADEKVESPTGKDAMASETKRARADWTKEQWDAYAEEQFDRA